MFILGFNVVLVFVLKSSAKIKEKRKRKERLNERCTTMTTNATTSTNYAVPCVSVWELNDFVPLTALNVPDRSLYSSERKKIPAKADLTTYATFNQFQMMYANADYIRPLSDTKTPEGTRSLTELVNYGGLFGVWFTAQHYFDNDGNIYSTFYGYAPATTVKHVAEELFNTGLKAEGVEE